MKVNEENKEYFLKAGIMAKKALLFGKKIAKPGEKVKEILDKIENKIKELGGEPAFPAQISINNIAAHYCSEENDDLIIKEDDVVKIDVGAHINGFIADNALTINHSEKYKELIKATEESLKEAIKIARPEESINNIGKRIYETLRSYGFNPIKNLGGHGLGFYQIHTAPQIPNFNNQDNTKLEENQVIAIEPFSTTGFGLVKNKGIATIFAQITNKPVRNPITKTILNKIKDYKQLPFTKRWLTRNFGEAKTNYALKELLKNKIIIDYPPLAEINNSFVAQFENTIIVKDKPIITTKEDD